MLRVLLGRILLPSLAAFAVFFAIALFWLARPVYALDTTSPWLQTADPTLKKIDGLPFGQLPPYSINGNRDCTFQKIVTRPQKIVPLQTELSFNNCAVTALYGSVNSSYLVRSNTGVGGLVKKWSGSTAPIIGVPYSDTAIYTGSGASVGSYIFFIKNFSSYILTSVNSAGEVTHTIQQSYVPLTLRDKNGGQLAIDTDSLAFSANGEWAVADAPYYGHIRINLRTFEVLQFDLPFSYNNGLNPSTQTAVSGDGRYAVVGSKTYNKLRLYDLENCTPGQSGKPMNCPSKDFQNLMKTNVSGYIAASYIRFVSNDSLKLYASYKDSAGLNQMSFYTLTAAGQQQALFGYLALGDSFASGEGAFAYKNGTDVKDPQNKCHLSTLSYPYLIGTGLSLSQYESVACSGAKMRDIEFQDEERYNDKLSQSKGLADPNLDGGIYGNFLTGYRIQKKFVEKYKPSIITVSTIGNDIGFGGIIWRCLAPDTCYQNPADRAVLAKKINDRFDELVTMYKQVKDAGDPAAKIYAIGYPSLVNQDGGCDVNVHLNRDELKFANDLVHYLNFVISRAATKAGVSYIDVENTFDGYKLCDAVFHSDMAVNGLTAGNDTPKDIGPIGKESYHPTAKGHQLFAARILEQTQSFTKTNPFEKSDTLDPNLADARDFIGGDTTASTKRYVDDESLADSLIFKSLLEAIEAEGFAPSSLVNIWLTSDPVAVGTATSDSTGTVSTTISIPDSVPTGFHTLHVSGTTVAGEPYEVDKVVYVAASEADYDGDGVPNGSDPCIIIEPAGVDYDQDGIDDACDGSIGDPPPAPEPEPEPEDIPEEIAPPGTGIIGQVDNTNSSNFLIPNGGGLQPQPGAPQNSGTINFLNSGSLTPQTGSGPSNQDILGQGTVVGQVDASSIRASAQDSSAKPVQGSNFANYAVGFGVLAAISIIGYLLFRKFY